MSEDRSQPTVAFATVGCRLNQAETESIAESFAARGYSVVEFSADADVYFINTCTVTGRADRSSRQLIHKARRKSPDSLVIAAGCFATSAAEHLQEAGEVDVILGVEEKAHPFDYLPVDGRPKSPVVAVTESGEATAPAVGTRISGRSRAFLKVQDGCDHACAYCAVTLVRGPSRSVPANEVATALKRIRNAGFEEVVFTGVDISAWGIDIDGEIRDYVDLVEMAAETGIPRIRVSSLEPWEIDPKRIERLAGIEPWCEHFHISLQSAAPYVLERMNRTTDIGKLKEALRELLRQRPRATLGADIIAGFPGEREQDFRQTLRFLDEGPIHYLHVFPYSIRTGTPAADFTDHLAPEVITGRAATLREEGAKRRRHHLQSSVGAEMEILVETDGSSGYTRNYLRTKLTDDRGVPRQRLQVLVTGVDDHKDLLYAKRRV